MKRMPLASALALALCAGCGLTTEYNNQVLNNAANSGQSNNGGTPSGEWTSTEHPCVGNRTDALWCDDMRVCFVGCGTTTTGFGLFMTTDGGESWAPAETTTPDYFAEARVNSISRGDDGLLYVAGYLPDDAGVVSLSGAGTTTAVFTRSNQVDFSFTPGTFRRAESGRAIAESLTGVDLVYRESDSDDALESWSSGRGFWSDGEGDDVPNGLQILDLEVHDGLFYGAGANINQPPTVFLPDWEDTFDFQIVRLTDAYEGEMWGIDVNDEGIAVGGVDQDRNVGMIYSVAHTEDAQDPAKWTAFDVSSVFPEKATWITDVCRASTATIYATGRESIEGWGFVLRSIDGGATFEDITPYDANGRSAFDDISRCQAFDDGVIIAGANGAFARYF